MTERMDNAENDASVDRADAFRKRRMLMKVLIVGSGGREHAHRCKCGKEPEGG